MVEAKSFVEKELKENIKGKEEIEKIPEKKVSAPIYTPPPQIQQEPIIQIVEKIVYKKQRIHGFFRTLTIIALLAIGFLMLGESTGVLTLSVNSFKLHQIFPLVIILSSIIIRSYKGIFGKLFGLIIFMTVWGGIFTIGIYTSLNPSTNRKSGNNINYTIPKSTGENLKNNLYIQTLIENSDIKGSNKNKNIQGTRNSERRLIVDSGTNETENYLTINEDTNRNVLENYLSTMDLILPEKITFDLFYIKNFFGLHTIDLSTFQRKMLKFHAGLSDITINVGNVLSGNKIEIEGAVANVKLNIPKDIGVLLYYKHLVGMLDTPQFDALSGHYFQSQNLTTAKSTLYIHVNLGIGKTNINWIDTK